MNHGQLRFIDRLYKDLYLDSFVIRYGTGNKYDKFENIDAYMIKLEIVHNKTALCRHLDMLRQ